VTLSVEDRTEKEKKKETVQITAHVSKNKKNKTNKTEVVQKCHFAQC
jgi:hypothetical protein